MEADFMKANMCKFYTLNKTIKRNQQKTQFNTFRSNHAKRKIDYGFIEIDYFSFSNPDYNRIEKI